VLYTLASERASDESLSRKDVLDVRVPFVVRAF